jgi:protein-S-isoprenylcysteine O-methyltransferase Ste14
MAGAVEARHQAGGLAHLDAATARRPAAVLRVVYPLALAAPPAAPRGAAALRARLLGWRPPLVALALAGAAGAVHLALWGLQAPWGRAGLAGGLLAAAGLFWALWAWALLRRAGPAARPADPPLVLVDEGPYRAGRHPMYLGLVALLLGAALGLGAPLLALAAGLLAAIVATVHVPHEEARLLARFGGWYRDYAGSVRRWL